MATHLNQKYLGQLKSQLHTYSEQRRDIIKNTGDALHLAKRAVFALQRDNLVEAKEKLRASEDLLKAVMKKYKKDAGLMSEGSLTAALEEYVEAQLFFSFVTTRKIGTITTLPIDGEIYLAGLCDVPGELYRYALKAATARDFALVKECAAAAEEIIGELVEFNLTSYLRTKFDQAKQAMQKLEQVVYETSLRG